MTTSNPFSSNGYPDDNAAWVSHETIYQWAYRQSLHGKTLYQRLRRSRKRRRRRIPGVIPGRVGIEERPAIVDERERFGDWESDTAEGAKGRGLVATQRPCKFSANSLDPTLDITSARLHAANCFQGTASCLVETAQPEAKQIRRKKRPRLSIPQRTSSGVISFKRSRA
ncbi:MAG: hypothetical protein AAGH88_00025 [Planctomycetota bacterium]